VEGGQVVMEREIEGGKEIVACPTPLVVGASEGMAEWKIPNMRGIMSARTKPLQVVEPVEVPQLVRTVSYDKPAPRSAVKMIAAEDAAKLFDILREEKKVI
jgi:electron transfer flavoprotein beta subunit